MSLFGFLVGSVDGSIRIDGVDLHSGPPDGNPHQGCEFVIEFAGFAEGPELFAPVSFESADGVQVVSGDLNPFVGEDPAGGESDVDARETYTLKFAGTAEVVITIGGVSKGFSVSGCTAATPTPTPTPSPTPTPTPSATPSATATPTPTPTTATPTVRPVPTMKPRTSWTPSPTLDPTTAAPVPQLPKPTPTPAPVEKAFVKGTSVVEYRDQNLVSTPAGIVLTAGGVLLAGAAVLLIRRFSRR